jgi:hypothetical protein
MLISVKARHDVRRTSGRLALAGGNHRWKLPASAAVVGVGSLVITLAAGATVAAAALLIQRRRHRLVLAAYTPAAIDRAATFVPEPQRAEAA